MNKNISRVASYAGKDGVHGGGQGGKQRADYGQFLIRNLAHRLGDEFGGGVSVANLWNFTLLSYISSRIKTLRSA